MNDATTISLEMNAMQDAALTATSTIRDDILTTLAVEGAAADPAFRTIQNLCKYASERSQSIFLLASQRRPWDAEIILRSYYETTIRLLTLTILDPARRKELATEYWGAHAETKARRRGQLAKFAASAFSANGQSFDAKILDDLADPEIFEFSELNKRKRASLERKWSFSELVRCLSELPLAEGGVAEINSVRHMFSQQSHLLHADAAAIELMIDRETRQASELIA